MPKLLVFLPVFAVLAVTGRADEPDWSALPYTPHADYQQVDAVGNGTFPLNAPVKLRGVILNHAADMLDGTPDAPQFLGGQWQIFVQSVDDGDFGGTALFMAQRYSDLPFIPQGDYTAQEWLNELYRLEHDPLSGTPLLPGDLVEIRARAPGLFFRGKTNVNEQHSIDPGANFDIYLLEAERGLPAPVRLNLADLKDPNDEFIFDPARQIGCEHYQGRLVRIDGVSFVDPTNWGPGAELAIQDDGGLTFPVKLGLGDGFTQFSAPAGFFDIYGILDQEDVDGGDGWTTGYRLWIMDYAGNPLILPEPFPQPGDMNCDGIINAGDIDPFVLALVEPDQYPAAFPACSIDHADTDGDGLITAGDIDPFIALLVGP